MGHAEAQAGEAEGIWDMFPGLSEKFPGSKWKHSCPCCLNFELTSYHLYPHSKRQSNSKITFHTNGAEMFATAIKHYTI